MEENTNVEVSPPNEFEKKSSNMLVVGIVAVAVVVGIGLIMLNNKGTSKEVEDMPVTAEESTMAPDVAGAATSSGTITTANGVTTVNLEAGSFYYKPNEIKVKQGDKVKIVMSSKDMVHNFNIDELKVSLPTTKAGETNTVEFTADKKGTFEYYCSIGQHRKNGQVGKITIE